uniref:Secreted protein n=1 Tax=Parastrongyloides trichosuri TaxID=131310 RepID=A0A0N4ZHH5_PARTI
MKYCLCLIIIIGFLTNISSTNSSFEIDETSKSCVIEVPTVQHYKGNCIKLAFNAYGCAAGVHLDPFSRDCIDMKK